MGGRVFFERHVRFHDLGDHFVLGRDLRLQRFVPTQKRLRLRTRLALEKRGQVLEHLLLPAIENGGLDLVPVTQIRDRYPVDQMLAQNGRFALGRETPSCFRHDILPSLALQYSALNEGSNCQVSGEAL
jgi:hypothetical protein